MNVTSGSRSLQRRCACGASAESAARCDECTRRDLKIQRSSTASTFRAIPSIVETALRTPGRSLDFETRNFMEARFGHDFRNVRVHTDELAAESATQLSADAYTVGTEIFFSRNQFRPGTFGGNRLLAHE